MTKTIRIFQSRLNKKLTCVKAGDPADQPAIDRILGCHPYGYTMRTGGMIGVHCPDSLDDLIKALESRGFTQCESAGL